MLEQSYNSNELNLPNPQDALDLSKGNPICIPLLQFWITFPRKERKIEHFIPEIKMG